MIFMIIFHTYPFSLTTIFLFSIHYLCERWPRSSNQTRNRPRFLFYRQYAFVVFPSLICSVSIWFFQISPSCVHHSFQMYFSLNNYYLNYWFFIFDCEFEFRLIRILHFFFLFYLYLPNNHQNVVNCSFL